MPFKQNYTIGSEVERKKDLVGFLDSSTKMLQMHEYFFGVFWNFVNQPPTIKLDYRLPKKDIILTPSKVATYW